METIHILSIRNSFVGTLSVICMIWHAARE